jgi:hypothetical protein
MGGLIMNSLRYECIGGFMNLLMWRLFFTVSDERAGSRGESRQALHGKDIGSELEFIFVALSPLCVITCHP